MEKLTYDWKKLRQNKRAYNLVLIAAIILAMAVTAQDVYKRQALGHERQPAVGLRAGVGRSMYSPTTVIIGENTD